MIEDETTDKAVVIVGAGVAGLFLSQELRKMFCGNEQSRRVSTITVLEARDRPGGRVRTVYDADGAILYESGPWRVPSNHHRVRRLFKEHGIALTPLRTPTPNYAHHAGTPHPGLSAYDVAVVDTTNPHYADRIDQLSGYADETFADSTTAPYQTHARSFYVAPDGFSAVCERMVDRTAEHDQREQRRIVELAYNTRVVNIVRRGTQYEITSMRRMPCGAFQKRVVFADVVFVCVPPHVAAQWPDFARHARVHLSRVLPGQLHHIYARGHCSRRHTVNPANALVQTISDQYGRGWFQASYTCGRMARFWQHLRLADDANGGEDSPFYALVRKLLRRHVDFWRPVPADRDHIKSHHWEHAYHIWRPVRGFDLAEAVASSVQPNPVRLPDLYWAGEAYSSFQAWMEGALETAEIALAAFQSGRDAAGPFGLPRAATAGEMVVEDRILGERQLMEWQTCHPGGAAAIARHLSGANNSALFEHIGHSENAWATIAGLQRGWRKLNDTLW
jgi:hypothetical protein